MIISFKKWADWAKFVVLFVLLTYLVSILFHEITEWIEPTERYKEPSGRAIKVMQQQNLNVEPSSMKERLRFFYWYGE